MTIRQLLCGLMLPSGCDAAYALADAVGTGSTVAARTKLLDYYSGASTAKTMKLRQLPAGAQRD